LPNFSRNPTTTTTNRKPKKMSTTFTHNNVTYSRTEPLKGLDARTAGRAFLKSKGIPSTMADSLTMPQLNAAWLDLSDRVLTNLKSDFLPSETEISEAKTKEAAFDAKAAAADKAKAGSEISLDDAKTILDIFNRAKGAGKAELDESRVIALIKEHSVPQPIRIEYKERHSGEHKQDLAHKDFARLLKAVSSGENVWLVGPAGTGKTTAAEQVAKVLGLEFHFNGALDSEHKLLGFVDAQGRIVSRPFRKAWTEGGVYLFDEVDASLPQALLAFNAALANGIVDFPDGAVRKHKDFVCIAGANTIGQGATVEYNGRYKPDAAFVDRFAMFKWEVDETLERTLALGKIADKELGNKWVDLVQKVRRKIASEGSVKHVVSPRASIGGCALLHAGFTWEEAIDSRLRKGLDAAVWARVSA
jgi:hypothetical protein